MESAEVEWRQTPTVLVDSVVGFVAVGGLPRITLGQVVFSPGDNPPKYIPVVTLTAPMDALRFLIRQIAEIIEQIDADQSKIEVADDGSI